MSFKESPLYSVLNNKCPHCHKGNFFVSNNPYGRDFSKMNDRCPVCGEDFRREPGYYFGATYVSYALTVGFGLVLFALLCWLGGMDVISFLIIFSLLLLVMLPLFFRFSRLIWIHFFVRYRK
jgi:uncharacterized protein (DUF983 family)